MTDLTAHGSADVDPAAGEVDDSRRKFLLRATIGMGAVGAAFTATPFIESWLPSERARALGGPTEVDMSKIEAGQMIITIWRRQPMYVVHRTPGMMGLLGNHDDRLKDATSEDSDQPAYCKNAIRSRNAEYLVLRGICTHLGCLPKQRFDAGDAQLGATWPGGWLCPCHGSRFDMAGRVFDGSPASVNLVIPPYSYPTPTRLVIGEDETTGTAAAAS
jgi:ubiquinol-cytochrome c reductase iron-sulfur subunit